MQPNLAKLVFLEILKLLKLISRKIRNISVGNTVVQGFLEAARTFFPKNVITILRLVNGKSKRSYAWEKPLRGQMRD